MARLHHPYVVTVFDVGSAEPGTGEDLPYVVMERVVGDSLDTLMVGGRIEPYRIAGILERVARALHVAHEAGIVHRDLKPSNVMVGGADHVKVLDFGLARLVHRDGIPAEESLTLPGMVLGSCPYMSPEQALGEEVGPPSDIFSCGVVLYEALAGQRPFEASTPVHVLQAVVACEPQPLAEVASDVPAGLAAIVERCLQRRPERRFATAAALADALARAYRVDDQTLSTGRTRAVRPRSRRPFLVRRKWWLGLVGLLTAAVAGISGVWLGRSGREVLRPDPGAWTSREILQLAGAVRHPDWNPSGDELVVGHTHDGVSRLLTVDVESPEPRTLTNGQPGEQLVWPRYSPDGKAVAVTVVRGGAESVRVVPVGGGPSVVEIELAARPTWRSRETLLVSRFEEGGSGLWEIDVETGDERRVAAPTADRWWWRGETRPGGGLALVGGGSDVRVGVFFQSEHGDRGLEEWLTPGRSVTGVSWSASGRSMVAAVDNDLVQLSNRGLRRLLPDSQLWWDPVFSRDGRRLAAMQQRRTSELILADVDGAGFSCALCGVQDAGWGSLGPDGSIVYRRLDRGERAVFLRSADGAGRRLTPTGVEASCPVMSPDGSRVAYLARSPGGRIDLNVVTRDGERNVTLAKGVEASEFPTWSPDGRALAFASGAPPRVMTVSSAGGEPKVLTADGGDYPQWSPDGRWIAYVVWTEASDPRQGVWVAPADGRGESRRIGRHPTQLAWAPSGVLLQIRRDGEKIAVWEASPGAWVWRRRATVDLGDHLPVHAEHRPLTVDPVSGDLVINRQVSIGTVVVIDGMDPSRW